MKKKSPFQPILFYLFFTPWLLQAQQWQRVLEVPVAEMSALFSTGDTLFAAGPNQLYFTCDGGESWQSTAVVHPQVDFIETLFFEQGRLFVGTVANGIFRSDDGGQSWQADNAGLGGPGASSISSLAARGDSLYAGTNGAGVFVKKITSDGPWSAYDLGMPWFNIFSLTNLDDKLYAGAGGNATFALQSQPGHGWVEKNFAEFNGSMNAMLGIVRQNDVLLAVGTLGLYRSADGGENWTPYNPGTGILGSARLLKDGNRIIANLAKPAQFSFIKTTEDQGLGWQDFEPAIEGSFGHDIALLNGVLYSARSNGLWRIVTTTPVHEPATPQVVLGQNFPNPFTGTTTFPVMLKQAGTVDFSIFDASGKLLETLWQGEHAAGEYRLEFNASGLAPGVYYGRLQTHAGVQSRRLVLLK